MKKKPLLHISDNWGDKTTAFIWHDTSCALSAWHGTGRPLDTRGTCSQDGLHAWPPRAPWRGFSCHGSRSRGRTRPTLDHRAPGPSSTEFLSPGRQPSPQQIGSQGLQIESLHSIRNVRYCMMKTSPWFLSNLTQQPWHFYFYDERDRFYLVKQFKSVEIHLCS